MNAVKNKFRNNYWSLVLLVIIGCGASLIWKAIKNFDPCNDATLGGDCYYAKYDAGFAAAQTRYQENRSVDIAQNSTIPNSVDTSEQSVTVSTNLILCAPVISGGNVTQAVLDANSGVWPPYDLNGVEMHVSIDHGDARIIRTLLNEVRVSDIVNAGDMVCISTNRSLLESR